MSSILSAILSAANDSDNNNLTFSVVRSSTAKIGFLEQDENTWIGLLYTKWKQIMLDTRPRTLDNPAEIECFLNIGAGHTVSVLSHVCCSRSRETTQCALKALTLSHALIHWTLDRLVICRVKWSDIREWDGKILTPVCIRASVLYWGHQRCTSGCQR